jgi:hypothetical protein
VSVIPALPPSNCYTHVGGKGRGQWWKNSVREEETNASFYYHGRRKKIIKTQGAGVWIGGAYNMEGGTKKSSFGRKKMNSKK